MKDNDQDYCLDDDQDCPLDCFELIDWTIENYPKFYQAIRYCHFSILVDGCLDLWKKKNLPQ